MPKQKYPEIQEGNFLETIDIAIKEKRHEDFLKQVLIDYKKYKEVFIGAFTDENPLNAIYVFRASYMNKHPVWRDIAILGNQTFCNLAETIVDWMDWDNDHMHGFSMKKVDGILQQRYTRFSMYAPGWEDDPYPTYKTNEIKIADINYVEHPRWGFVFDFGDGHEFDIELKTIDTKAKRNDFEESLPTCIDQRGVAPLQYLPLKNDEKEWEYDENCPHCQELKKAGIKLAWFSDEDKK